DKATMEVMGYAAGILLHIGVEKGQAAKVNGIIAIVGPEGTDISGILSQGDAPAAADKTAAAATPEAEAAPVAAEQKETVTADGGRVKASPLAKRIAKEKGIDLAQVA